MISDLNKKVPTLVHPLHYPQGYDEKSLFKYLDGFRLDGAENNELANYLACDFKRFVYTLNLVPEAKKNSTLFEIGANPYFTSILLKKFTTYQTFFSNYFGGEIGQHQQVQANKETGDVFEFDFYNHNIETDDIPFKTKFDVVIFCEVIEHLTNDPVLALSRIKNSLKEGGHLILSTPNIARLENISKLMAGENIHDPYSGYGPYGRHNREYNQHELFLLFNHLGFEIEVMFSSDVHQNNSEHYFPVSKYLSNLRDIEGREHGLGQYIFVRARNTSPAKKCKPNWLYRSYPADELCDNE
jgi:SAM-dependent methyltransferase